MKSNTIDLHVHTTNSDGTKSPDEVLIEAEQIGLKFISITDHYCQSYPIDNNGLFSGKVLRGIELRANCRKRGIELLGYGYCLETMQKLLPTLYRNKEELNLLYLDAIISKLQEHKVQLPKDVKSYFTDPTMQPAKFISKLILQYEEKRDYNLDILHSDKIIHKEGESFYRGWVSNPNSAFFVEFDGYPEYEDTISLIKSCNGKVFIPHIFKYTDMSIGILDELLSSGAVDGIECYYPTFTKEQSIYLKNRCKEHHLLISGGSDYHGANKKNQLGRGLNDNLYIPEDEIDWIHSLFD